MGFTWRSHYVPYLLLPLFCTIMPYTHKFTPTFSEMASHPHIHPHIHPHTCTQTPPIHLHTHPHPIQPVTDCQVRSKHSLDSYNFPVNLMSWVSVVGILLVLHLPCGGLPTIYRGQWRSPKGGWLGVTATSVTAWLRSDMTCVTMAQLTPNSTGLYGREKNLR